MRIASYQRLPQPRGRGRRSPSLPGEQRTLASTLQEEDRPAWYRTTNSGAAGAAVRCIAAVARSLARSFARSLARVVLVDDSRLRRYNCGLRSETRGNPRERRFLRLCAYRRVRACICVPALHRVCAQRPVGIHTAAKGKRKRDRRTKRGDTKAIHPERAERPLLSPADKSLLLPCFSSYAAPGGTSFYDATWKSLSFDRESRRSTASTIAPPPSSPDPRRIKLFRGILIV